MLIEFTFTEIIDIKRILRVFYLGKQTQYLGSSIDSRTKVRVIDNCFVLSYFLWKIFGNPMLKIKGPCGAQKSLQRFSNSNIFATQ